MDKDIWWLAQVSISSQNFLALLYLNTSKLAKASKFISRWQQEIRKLVLPHHTLPTASSSICLSWQNFYADADPKGSCVSSLWVCIKPGIFHL